MAVSKVIKSTTLSIEIENGQDKTGATVYKKKNFSGVKANADGEKVLAVADAIKVVLQPETRDCFINECSTLTNA